MIVLESYNCIDIFFDSLFKDEFCIIYVFFIIDFLCFWVFWVGVGNVNKLVNGFSFGKFMFSWVVIILIILGKMFFI